ncbi:MAG: tRNA uracil 4-sulfurtransferase ThiI [Porticoccaceae bacterium]
MHFIVKLFPEIIIKSAPVRARFIRQLRDNLRRLIASRDAVADVRNHWDHIEIIAPGDAAERDRTIADILACTPGVASFSAVHHYPLHDYDDMAERAWSHYGELLRDCTFCVRVKRMGRHGFSSTDVEREVGARLFRRVETTKVKLIDPDITVRLDIRDDKLYVVESTRRGLGGFPLGTQDAVMSLISGGFDSTVASFLTMKRGLRTHFCFFNLGGRAHEVGVKTVAHYLWSKYGASHMVKFITVPFEDVVAEILTKVDQAQMGVVLKRMMLRAATRVAHEWQVEALVTGESVAQVSSQTLANLAVIDAATDMLVLRPLATTDKSDIIDTARAIGTAEFAANMPEYCGVISVRPTTRARPDRVAHAEERFDFAVLERAIERRRAENIDTVISAMMDGPGIEIFSAPQPDAIILDIRHPDEILCAPLNTGAAAVQQMPFYRLQQAFAELDQRHCYLLYCGKGIISRLHAELLHEQGFTNTAVYRP